MNEDGLVLHLIDDIRASITYWCSTFYFALCFGAFRIYTECGLCLVFSYLGNSSSKLIRCPIRGHGPWIHCLLTFKSRGWRTTMSNAIEMANRCLHGGGAALATEAYINLCLLDEFSCSIRITWSPYTLRTSSLVVVVACKNFGFYSSSVLFSLFKCGTCHRACHFPLRVYINPFLIWAIVQFMLVFHWKPNNFWLHYSLWFS